MMSLKELEQRFPANQSVIGFRFLTISVVISGLGLVLVQEWDLLQNGEYSARTARQWTITVIEAIDMFLVGAVSNTIAVGIYKLFISEEDDQSLKRFKIEKRADLENKIVGIVVVALAVGFVGKAAEAPGPLALLHGGVGIAVVIGALCLFLKFSGPAGE